MFQNPYLSGYTGYPMGNFGQNTQQYAQKQEVIKVNGRGGAEAYQLAPNSSILLLDEKEPIIWLKTTDGAGYASITPYTISPYQPEPPIDVKSLEERISKIEVLINESNNANAWRGADASNNRPDKKYHVDDEDKPKPNSYAQWADSE